MTNYLTITNGLARSERAKKKREREFFLFLETWHGLILWLVRCRKGGTQILRSVLSMHTYQLAVAFVIES